jgi:hypothetical protein
MKALNASYRLLVTAGGEWWDTLTDEMKKQYIEEHPDSQYAKGFGLSSPKQEVKKPGQAVKPTGQGKGLGPVKPSFGPRDPATKQALRNLPPKVQKFVNDGGTAKGSEARKKTGQEVKAKSPGLARGILKDAVGVAKGAASIRNIVNAKPKPGDFGKAASFIGNVLGATAFATVLGTTGPVGILTFMAVKHLAAPQLYRIAQKAFSKRPPPQGWDDKETGYGYWKDDNTWVPMSKKEWDKISDEEVNEYQDTGHDPHGKFKNAEKKGTRDLSGDDHGYWENGKWHPQSKEDWVRDFKNRGPGSRGDIRSALVNASPDEEGMQKLIEALCDYAENGEIPPEAWKAAIAEMGAGAPDEEAK